MRAFLALMIALVIILFIGVSSYLLIEYQHYRNTMTNIDKNLKQERIEKQRSDQRRLEHKKRQEKQRRLENKIKKYNKQEQYQKKSYTETKYKKRYHRYSKFVNLKSDSKISLLRDNRLISNLPIYGTYKGIVMTRPVCPKNRIHDLNMYNECYVKNMHGDKFYFKKELVDNFNNYRNRKIINCHYNKKHGIMQDCKI